MVRCVWNRYLLYDFIDKYESFTCLWLLRDQNYYNRTEKTRAYQLLADMVQKDFPDADELFVKKKIKNIRCAFRKEHNKKKKLLLIGQIYKPKLWYYDLLLFTVVGNNKPETTEDEQDDMDMLEVEN